MTEVELEKRMMDILEHFRGLVWQWGLDPCIASERKVILERFRNVILGTWEARVAQGRPASPIPQVKFSFKFSPSEWYIWAKKEELSALAIWLAK